MSYTLSSPPPPQTIFETLQILKTQLKQKDGLSEFGAPGHLWKEVHELRNKVAEDEEILDRFQRTLEIEKAMEYIWALKDGLSETEYSEFQTQLSSWVFVCAAGL